MEIRLLTEADAAPFWELRLKSLQEEPEAFGAAFVEECDKPLESIIVRFRNEWASPENFLIVGAFLEGKLVGLVGLFREQRIKLRHKATVWGMYVLPEYRNIGIGKTLLLDLIGRAKGIKGLEQLNLSVVETKQAAAKLYASCGFKAYGLEERALKVEGKYYAETHMVLQFD